MNSTIMNMMISILPEEVIIQKLEEAISEHKMLKTTETRKELEFRAFMMISKLTVAKDLESAMAYGEKAEEIEKKLKIFDVKEN